MMDDNKIMSCSLNENNRLIIAVQPKSSLKLCIQRVVPGLVCALAGLPSLILLGFSHKIIP